MSSRVFRKTLVEKEKRAKDDNEDESEEEDEPVVPVNKVKNAFDLLAEDDEVDETPDDEDWIEEDHKEIAAKQSSESKPNVVVTSKSSTKKKSNKKKNNKKKSSTKSKEPSTTKSSKDEEEDIDEIIKQFSATSSSENNDKANEANAAQHEKSIFTIDPAHLNSENELKRIFGKQTVKEAMKDSKSRRVGNYHKKMLFVKPKQNWPPISSGIGMEFIESKKGINYFRITWSPTYRRLQGQFYMCVQSGDPSSFQSLLQHFPYHVDSLIQLAAVCNQTGQFETAMDLLERALFAFESGFSGLFNVVNGSSRLLYSLEENKTFFLAVFRFIQMLGREGTSRTALEYCKVLLSLDRTDPLFILFIIDYYAIRAQQYEFVLQLYSSNELEDKRLSILPNWCFSVALAKFKLEQKNAKTSTTTSTSSNSQVEEIEMTKKSSNELLQHALLLFPMVLSPLAKKSKPVT